MRTGRSLTICQHLLLEGAWIWSPSISPLGVGLDLIPLNFPLGVGLDLIPSIRPLGCGPRGGLLGRGGEGERGWGVLVAISLAGGVSLAGGWVSQHALKQTPPPPMNRMTDRCKNITLATTSLRPVITEYHFNKWMCWYFLILTQLNKWR